jgi:hypothetical protein
MRRWTKEEDKFLLDNPNLPHSEISKILDRSILSIRGRLSRKRWVKVLEPQIWVEKDNYYELKLSNKKLGNKIVLISKNKIDLVKSIRWSLHTNGFGNIYVANKRKNPRITTLMHVLISGYKYIDHINGNGLDNRNDNLRPASKQQNAWNARPMRKKDSGKYKGVYCKNLKRGKSWEVKVGSKYVGRFKNEEEAARAYDAKAIELFGEFARLNFPVDNQASN